MKRSKGNQPPPVASARRSNRVIGVVDVVDGSAADTLFSCSASPGPCVIDAL